MCKFVCTCTCVCGGIWTPVVVTCTEHCMGKCTRVHVEGSGRYKQSNTILS